MTPIKTNLWDSVTLSSIRTDKFKTGVLSLSLRLPLTKKRCAHNTLLSGVLRRGTQKYGSVAVINRRLDELYAATVELKNARCGKNVLLTLSAEMLDGAYVTDGTDVLDGVLEVLSEMLLRPRAEDGSFLGDAVEKEKNDVKDAIKATVNNPRAYASDRCAELLHRNDPDFPTLEELYREVSAADGKSLFGYYRELLGGSPLSFYYVGSESCERVGELIKKHFGAFHSEVTAPASIKAETALELLEKTETLSVSQGKLAMGFRVGVCMGEKDYFAAVMFNEIFGGSPASKLFMNVRERLSLCYYCSSRFDTYMGNITVSAGINVSDKDKTYREILAQLDAIRKGDISDAELTAAKKALAHSYKMVYDYPAELISFYANKAMFGISASPEKYTELFCAVTKEDVARIARGVVLDSVFFLKGDREEDGEEDIDE